MRRRILARMWFRCYNNGNYLAVMNLSVRTADRRSEVDRQPWLPPNSFKGESKEPRRSGQS